MSAGILSLDALSSCADDSSIDPESDVQQDSEEDYEEDEDAGADDDGEYGDGDGDPCPNCGRKYRCRREAGALFGNSATQLILRPPVAFEGEPVVLATVYVAKLEAAVRNAGLATSGSRATSATLGMMANASR